MLPPIIAVSHTGTGTALYLASCYFRRKRRFLCEKDTDQTCNQKSLYYLFSRK